MKISLSPGPRRRRGIVSALALLGLALCVVGPFAQSEGQDQVAPDSTNAVDSVAIPWGDPSFVEEDAILVPGPAWWRGAFKEGGLWLPPSFNATQPEAAGLSAVAPGDEVDLPAVALGGGGWYAPADLPPDEGSLYMLLNPEHLTNDLTMELDYFDSADAALWLDLTDTNALPVATNLVGNLFQGSNAATRVWIDLPLLSYSNAAGFRLRRGSGQVAVFATRLYPVGTDIHVEEQSVAGALPGSGASGVGAASDSPLDVSGSLGTDAGADAGGVVLPATSATIFVDCQVGNDANDGLASGMLSAGVGPMKSIQAALKRARAGDRVSVAGGIYHGDVDICGLAIEFVITGDVTLTD